jgi:hypothetical protein
MGQVLKNKRADLARYVNVPHPRKMSIGQPSITGMDLAEQSRKPFIGNIIKKYKHRLVKELLIPKSAPE